MNIIWQIRIKNLIKQYWIKNNLINLKNNKKMK